MKKTFILLIAAVAALLANANHASAQYNPFSTGNVLVQGVIGVPTAKTGSCHIPPFGISAEIGAVDLDNAGVLGVGASFEYSKYDFAWTVYEGIVAYHYFLVPSFELHARVGIGYHSLHGHYSDSSLGGFSRSFFAGATYFLTDNLGVTAEVGASMVTSIRAGITFKF